MTWGYGIMHKGSATNVTMGPQAYIRHYSTIK